MSWSQLGKGVAKTCNWREHEGTSIYFTSHRALRDLYHFMNTCLSISKLVHTVSTDPHPCAKKAG